jgi:hypothetical protein
VLSTIKNDAVLPLEHGLVINFVRRDGARVEPPPLATIF